MAYARLTRDDVLDPRPGPDLDDVGADLNDRLQSPERVTRAVADLHAARAAAKERMREGLRQDFRASVDLIRAQAELTARRVDDAAIALMVSEPWRISRAVYPWKPAAWPVEDRSTDDVLADCRSYIAACRAIGKNPWAGDMNRLAALRLAEAALVQLSDGVVR